MKLNPVTPNFAARRKTVAMTLVELLVSCGLGSLVLSVIAMLWFFSARSFASLGNYTELDQRSQHALDLVTRDVRECSQVIAFTNTGPVRTISLTNEDRNINIKYTWDSTLRTLVCEKTGEAPITYLTECESCDFVPYQRTPLKNKTYVFYPATNINGNYDVTLCKLVSMNWKCTRSILGNAVNSERTESAQIVLRNKQ
jgi:hypothetical protein